MPPRRTHTTSEPKKPLPPPPPPPPKSRTPGLAISDETRTTILLDSGQRKSGAEPIRIYDSEGAALKEGETALFGKHRPADGRIVWILPATHDSRVNKVLDWIQMMSWGLACLGLHKFLQTRGRGALIANAAYRSPKAPQDPAFDWISYEDAQRSHDKVLQESIKYYNPATTALVFVFITSKSGSSCGIWRRKLDVPLPVYQTCAKEIDILKGELAKQSHPLHLDAPPKPSTSGQVAARPTVQRSATVSRKYIADQQNQKKTTNDPRARKASHP